MCSMQEHSGSSPDGQPKLVAIVGPTAVGKTALALALAELLPLEVISADSRQVYRHMDIGTAKPTHLERQRVPHHLIDIVNPDEVLTLAQYQEAAFQAIEDTVRRGKVPFLVGGTGLYVHAVVENWQVPRVPPSPALRQELEERARREGALALHRFLAQLDPVAASRIHPNNVRRVIRALEVTLSAGEPITRLQGKGAPRYRTLMIGLSGPRHWLYERADARVDAMIAQGLVAETKRLLDMGYSPSLPAMSGLGYRQICQHLLGHCSLEEAIRRIKAGTHRFIRQQHTWFRLDDPHVEWQMPPFSPERIAERVQRFLTDC
jgi:tRNA dimethylallyltransferase